MIEIFTSPEGEAEYRAAYEAMFDLWPCPHQAVEVPTRFGPTYINACGPEDGPPLLLLHAAGISSTSFFANIGPLSQDYRVYAVDMVGDAGKSRATRLLESRSDHAEWLKDVFNGLGIQQAFLLGHSQGGWIALSMALAYPQRVKKLVLLAPAASIASFGWLTKLVLALAGRMIRPSARFILKTQGAQGAVFDEALVHLMDTMSKHCLPATMVPTEYSDEELKQISMPTLLLIGDQEIIYKPAAAIERARRFIPNLEADIIPSAGHTLMMEQAEAVNARVLEFLGNQTTKPTNRQGSNLGYR
jgi:pimeloyl-ACP methyl ester carboxylesterase